MTVKTNRYQFRYKTEEEFQAQFISVRSVFDMTNAEMISMTEAIVGMETICHITYRYEERDEIKLSNR